MAEQTSQGDTGRRRSFVERMVDKITGKHHHHEEHPTDAASQAKPAKQQHKFGMADNAHDNAYVAEANMVGAHAIPPMTFHAEPNNKSHRRSPNPELSASTATQAQTQAQTQQVPPQEQTLASIEPMK